MSSSTLSSVAAATGQVSQEAATRKRQRQTTLTFWLFVAPLVLGLIIFVYIPIIWGFILSFFQARATITPQLFVGLDNYTGLLQSIEFTQSLSTVTLFAIFIVPTTVAFSLTLALLVNSIHF